MNKTERMDRAKANLIGIDAAPKIREALQELRDEFKAGARRAEVDGPQQYEANLDVPCLLVEKSDGSWSCETTSTIFPGQAGTFATIDSSERLALAEMRWRLVEEMVRCRFARPEEAKKLALKAKIYSVGRIPHLRIVSK